jgi:hypothetical protein
MKKMLILAMVMAVLFIGCEYEESSTSKNDRANEMVAKSAQTAVEVPIPQNFLERENVAAWFKNWDSPGKITYLYIFTAQDCIGYFKCDGKPISTRSYLTPEEAYYANGAVLQTPSLDGTYGSDNEGIRFKDDRGKWYEFGGTNFSYIYSDNRIPGLKNVQLNAD